MNKIRFSHCYHKLVGVQDNSAQLIDVLPIRLEDRSDLFLFYDTDGVYKLPKTGAYLMLIFLKTPNDIFTTLRRSTPRKNEYYRSKIGERFEISIEVQP